MADLSEGFTSLPTKEYQELLNELTELRQQLGEACRIVDEYAFGVEEGGKFVDRIRAGFKQVTAERAAASAKGK